MRLCVGMPIYDTVPGIAFGRLLATAGEAARLGEVTFASPFGIAPHDRARNICADVAIQTNCEYLFFVDIDTIVPLGSLRHMVGVMRDTGAHIVSGHYYRRGYPFTCVWSKRMAGGPDSEEWSQVDAEAGIHEIGTSGLGCALIDIQWVKNNLSKPYFHCGINQQGTFVTDDITFYRKVGDMGGKILGDAYVRCGHVFERVVVTDDNVKVLRERHRELNPEVSDSIDYLPEDEFDRAHREAREKERKEKGEPEKIESLTRIESKIQTAGTLELPTENTVEIPIVKWKGSHE